MDAHGPAPLPQQGPEWDRSQPGSSLLQLLHPVEGAACTEPLDLCLVESVVQQDGLLGPIGVLDDAVQRLARGKVLQALNGQLVHWMNLVVVRGVSKGEGQQALLL